MAVLSPPLTLRAGRQTIRTSPGVTVIIDSPENASWVTDGESQFEVPSCDCGGTHDPCAAHVKADGSNPLVGSAEPVGFDLTRECSTPYKEADLKRQVQDALEATTDLRLSEMVADLLKTIPVAQQVNTAYGATQALAVLLAEVSGIAGGTSGVVWASPYVAALLVSEGHVFIGANGQLSTTIGLHDLVVLPGWSGSLSTPDAAPYYIAWTPPMIVHLTEIVTYENVDINSNVVKSTGERYAILQGSVECARAVQVDLAVA